MKRLFSIVLILSSALCLTGCTDIGGTTATHTPSTADQTVAGVDYTDTVLTDADVERWKTENNLDNNPCSMPGIIVSPYFTMTINGETIPVFAERTANGPHNIAYVLVDTGAANRVALDVEITTHTPRQNPVVLPESAGVTAAVSGTTVTARITDFGSFTFTFDKDSTNDGSALPLTVMVKPREPAPQADETQYFDPGTYSLFELYLYEPGLYYFRKGVYTIEGIRILNDDVQIYFEPGTLLVAKPLTTDDNGAPAAKSIFTCNGFTGVKISGHAVLDLSYRPSTGVIFAFEHLSQTVFRDLHVVNSNSWTCCFTNCTDVDIRDLLLIGYKTYSDGVMLSDCKDVTVSGCFVRTGDDAMEVKSTSAGSVRTENILFENNAVWTDKGIGYGCVYESNFSQKDVTWRNNSVGYALANWSSHLGCTTISIHGNNPTVEDYDMHFEDIEIYYSRCPVITLVMHKGGSIHDVYFRNIHAKEVVLNPRVSESYIDLIIKNEDGGPLLDFTLDRLYFDNISYNGTTLTRDNAATEIRFSVPADFPADRSILYVNTK